jgi:hypothetical protein
VNSSLVLVASLIKCVLEEFLRVPRGVITRADPSLKLGGH